MKSAVTVSATSPRPTCRPKSLSADAARNAEFLAPFLGGGRAQSYAFPYGAASIAAKKFLGPRFSNLRGVHPGINSGKVDLAQLQAVSVETRNWNSQTVARAIRQAQHNNAWIVFYTHDVSDTPSPYGATAAMLREVLDGLAAARIPILPMREAVKVALASVRSPARSRRALTGPGNTPSRSYLT